MITSVSNPKIKNVVSLRKNARERKKQNCFLVEGPRMFFEVPADRLQEVYLTREFFEKYEDRLHGISCELISDSVCRHLSDTKTPQGVIAVVKRTECSLLTMLDEGSCPCFMLLENIQDPGNLGTILRTAEAAGVTGIIMNRGTVDPYNPKVIRATMGAVFRIPFLVAEDFPETILRLVERGVVVHAAHLGGETFYDADFRGPCAFLIGNEGSGLTPEACALSSRLIKIPMKGEVESLNAAVAASLIMYEVMRQRDR